MDKRPNRSTALVESSETEASSQESAEVLRVEHLFTQFGTTRAVEDVSFVLRQGEVLAIVGESGSGKSATMMSILNLVRYVGGRVSSGHAWFEGQDLLSLSNRKMQSVRGARIGMIFQDPMTSLNPVLTIGHQISETLSRHLQVNRRSARQRAVELLDLVRIPDAERKLSAYPHQLSGGMRQRVMIALALSCRPSILIADEPTTALDVTVQAQIMELLGDCRRQFNMAVIIISHDLGVVAGIADRVAVMYAGSVVEMSRVEELYEHARHPYTLGLLRCSPRVDTEYGELATIAGVPPELKGEPCGCAFQPRCPFAVQQCVTETPILRIAPNCDGKDHVVACWRELDDASRFDYESTPTPV